MPTALFISPHLDDVAFSCGGTLQRLADDARWRVVLCTIFTASVENPQGFALRCQTDKGLPPEADYMALRREEDRAYAAHAGNVETRHWAYREAPHRGYESPGELFAGVRPEDGVWQPLRDGLTALRSELQPARVFAPQGLGNHVDHRQTIHAVLAVYDDADVHWYRDTPYAIRDPAAQPSALLPTGALRCLPTALSPDLLARKIAGCCLYTSQIGFQFDGPNGVREKLTAFHRREAETGRADAEYAETFLAAAPL